MANKLISIIPSGTNNYLTPSLAFNGVATDHTGSGAIGTITNSAGAAPMTGSMSVNAQGSPNMSVAVGSGTAYVSATPSGGSAQNFRVTSDASENVTIQANATGSNRYDFVYVQIDSTKLNNPAVTALDVVSFVTSRSTSAYDPTNSGGAWGNSNGAQTNTLLLAVVTVANSASSISNSNITDARNRSVAHARSSLAQTASVATSETTTSTSYADLTTTTDTVTVLTGGSGSALVTVSAAFSNSGANLSSISFTVSGASTLAASDINAIQQSTTGVLAMSKTILVTGLVAGANVFKMKYKVAAGTGTFLNRNIAVVPL